MKYSFSLFVFLLLNVKAFSQSAQREKLPDLKISTDTFHYRFGNEIYAFDIWTNDFIHFEGRAYYWAETSRNRDSKGNTISIRHYSTNEAISDSAAKQLYMFLLATNVLNIPTRDSIKGWQCQDCLDGENIFTEEKTGGKYKLKKYYSPYSYRNVPEALVIDSLHKYIVSLLNARYNWGRFINTLPQAEYYAGGFAVTYSNGPTYKAWLRKQKKK